MKMRSFWAVAAGVLVIIVVTTLVDTVLHLTGIYPPLGQPMNDTLALLATSYRIVISIGGAWLTARLAPDNRTTSAWGGRRACAARPSRFLLAPMRFRESG